MASVAIKAKECAQRIKDEVKSLFRIGGPQLQLAFSYAGAASFGPVGPLVEQHLKPADYCGHISKFDTGPFPEKGTPSRGLAEWEPLHILYPNEINDARKGWKRFIEMKEAQKEVKKMLEAPGACHEYIAYEAAKLSRDESAIRYTLHIMVGAGAEDYVFMPGETLDDLFVKKPAVKYKSREEYARAIVPLSEREPEVPSLLKSMFWLVAKIWKKITGGSIQDDAINRPYMAHFYDNSREEGDRGLNVQHGEIKFQSALDRFKAYWKLATIYYQKGEKSKAYVALGHMVHLVSDMHVPAHVHNDIHGPTILLGKLDSLEQWAKRSDYPHIQRGEKDMNIKIWSSASLVPPHPDASWVPENIDEKIDSFINGIVNVTRQFKSVDAEGDAPGQKVLSRKGLTDDECYNQAAHLIPLAIQNSSQLIVNFIDYQRRLESRSTGSDVAGA
ncbi:MAG: hypothetical protein N3G76_02340 [Candidatus Micrarchaeota archaeon]|nr:hypothetical protein [Candidatus Micrarchaeota archaeon]